MSKTRWLVWSLCAVAALVGASVLGWGGKASPVSAQSQGVELVAYNQGFALVKDRRSLPQGSLGGQLKSFCPNVLRTKASQAMSAPDSSVNIPTGGRVEGRGRPGNVSILTNCCIS